MAILALDPQSGTSWNISTLELARTQATYANKTIVVTSALTQAQSNITAAWPTDRVLEVKKGGSIVNSTTFTATGSVNMTGGTFSGAGAVAINGPFSAGDYHVFTGAGTVTGLKEARPEWFATNTTPGTTDMTDAVGKAIMSNAHTILRKGQTYAVTGVDKTGLTNFTIDGGGKLFLLAGSNKRVLSINSSSHFSVSDLEIDGNGANQNVTSGDRNEGAGIQVYLCTNFTVEKNYVHDNFSGAGLLIISKVNWNDATVVTKGKILNNKVFTAGHGGSGTYASDGIYIFSDYTQVFGNIVHTTTDYGIASDYSYRIDIENNTVVNIPVTGIAVLGTNGATIHKNKVNTSSLGIAVTLGGNPATTQFLSNNVLISANTVTDTTVVGLSNDAIYVDASATNVTVDGNFTVNSARGIVASGIQSTVINNTVKTTTGVGIYLGGVYSQMANNSIKNTTGAPVQWTAAEGQSVDDITLTTFTDVASILSSWSNYGTPYHNFGYNIKGKVVTLRGSIKTGGTTPGSPLALLPSGYRPLKTQSFTAANNNLLATIDIDSAGNVLIGAVNNNVRLSFDGISFSTD